ncbi:phage tail length tape measure family protein [Rhizobium sp. NLR22b]|uniref:phage tail length tape measure family protein n=1 Tax=Rhizobium sp. NLR22b TaxID=2731115 RepID=UPI001C82FBC1|nr:phage tail length tape measure family protein [Rhizobium sp. NLR22b]
MADNTDDLIISISTDQATLRRSIQRIERDLAGLSGSVQKQFTAVGKSIDNSISSTMQNRINAMVGIGTKASKEWTGALADQGKELERLRAKYNPLFGAQQTYAAGLKEIKQAHAIGAISASEMTAALNREKIAFASQVSAIKARNAALEAMPANDNRVGGAFQTANIAAQFQDIGVTAAMGMNPLQIALQQGTQLSSVLATMGGGKQAISGLAAAFASLLSPISLVTIGLVAGSAALVQYFTAGEDGAKKTTPLIEKQNEVIRDAAAAWGEALPSVTKVVDQLDRAKQISTGREAGDILGARALEGLGEKLEGINRQFAEAMRGLRGIQADPAFVRDFGKAFSDLKERLDNGTASIADINNAQQMLAIAVDQYGVKSVLGFRDAFDKITESIQKSIAASKQAREEWIRALAGGTSVQDIAAGATFRDENGKTHQTGTFTPTVGPTPQSRPLIELEGLPGADKADKQAETAATKAANAYRDLLKSADDRLGQMLQEIDLQGKYGVAADTARFRLDLLQQAEDKGRSLNAEQRVAIEQKVALYGQYADVLSKTKLQQDLVSQARFNSLSKEDQQVLTMLRQYGRPEDLHGDDANQIRSYLRTEDLRGDLRSFAGDFKDALLNNGGDIGKAFAESIQRPICGAEHSFNLDLGDFYL